MGIADIGEVGMTKSENFELVKVKSIIKIFFVVYILICSIYVHKLIFFSQFTVKMSTLLTNCGYSKCKFINYIFMIKAHKSTNFIMFEKHTLSICMLFYIGKLTIVFDAAVYVHSIVISIDRRYKYKQHIVRMWRIVISINI